MFRRRERGDTSIHVCRHFRRQQVSKPRSLFTGLFSFLLRRRGGLDCRLPQRESLLISSHYSAPNLQNNAGLPLPSSAVILAIQWRQQLPLPPSNPPFHLPPSSCSPALLRGILMDEIFRFPEIPTKHESNSSDPGKHSALQHYAYYAIEIEEDRYRFLKFAIFPGGFQCTN